MTASSPGSDTDAENESDTREQLKRYAPWVIGGLLMLAGLGSVVSPEGNIRRSTVGGILLFIAGAVAFPPTRRRLDARTEFQLTGATAAAIVIVAFLAGGAILPPTTDQPDAGVDGDGATDTPTATRTDTTAAGSAATGTTGEPATSTPTDTPARQGIQQVAADTLREYGLLTGVSPDGSYVAFGLNTGNFVVYDVKSESFDSRPTSIDSSPSHIQIRDDGYATVAWMDAHSFGAIDLTSGVDEDWATEFNGLWDIDTNGDHSRVAVVTSPDTGAGRVSVASGDGELQWEQSLQDAGSQSVALTDDGSYVAVGAVKYWTQSGEMAGTPGVRLHDGQTGEELWQYETATEVWDVDIHADEERVVAVTDERVIVLDFDGNVVWEQDTTGSLWAGISEDGSTVATLDNGKPVAYDAASGEVQWRASDAPGYIAGERVAMSADGSRIIATEAVGWTYVVDDGEVIWQEQREDNPANVDIATNGRTWSVIVQDNDAQQANVFVYRDYGDGS